MRKVIIITMLALILVPSAAVSQRTRQFPVYDNGGKPDLVVNPQRFVSQMKIVDRFFAEGDCAIEEGAAGGTGSRRILRFDTVVMNRGNGDFVPGERNDPNNPHASAFEVAACHGHQHIRGFSSYELLNKDRTVVVAAHKEGLCFDEPLKYRGEIDITGVPEGDYIVRVTVNAAGTFDEGQNRYTNQLETSIHVPNPRKKVAVEK